MVGSLNRHYTKKSTQAQNIYTTLVLRTRTTTGSIPSTLGHCLNLTDFSVAETYGTLNGTIPTELGQLKRLEYLDLSHNRISGKIPEQLFETSNLRHLFLQHNRLTGTIPRSIESCNDLVELSVSDNKLNGTIPSSLPRKLQVVRIDRNDFSGLLPVESIHNMSNLVEFHADRNQFEGAVNDAFSNASSLEILNVAHNKLNGSVPMLSELKNLIQLILRDNEFDRVQSYNFARDESLRFLDLSRQRSSSLVLESHSFAYVVSHRSFISQKHTRKSMLE